MALSKLARQFPGRRNFAITPNDAVVEGVPVGLLLCLTYSEDTLKPFDRLYVGGTGNINVEGVDGTAVLFSAVPVGMLNVSGRKVLGTSTTATNIVGIKD